MGFSISVNLETPLTKVNFKEVKKMCMYVYVCVRLYQFILIEGLENFYYDEVQV